MSTLKWDKTAASTAIPCGRWFVVEKGRISRETLADYVRRVRDKNGWSLVEVSRRAGGAIGRTHINRIENGFATNPSPRKLRALARGLGVPEEELEAVVAGRTPAKKGDADEMQLLFYFRDLSPTEKEGALRIMEALRGGGGQTHGETNEDSRGEQRKRRRA